MDYGKRKKLIEIGVLVAKRFQQFSQKNLEKEQAEIAKANKRWASTKEKKNSLDHPWKGEKPLSKEQSQEKVR
jgi:hypothetical protein